MDITSKTDHIQHQIYGSGITTLVEIDELVNGIAMTTYYEDDKDAGLGIEERFSIYIDKGRIMFQRKKSIPRYADDGSPWGKDGKILEPMEIVTTEVLKDYTVRPQ